MNRDGGYELYDGCSYDYSAQARGEGHQETNRRYPTNCEQSEEKGRKATPAWADKLNAEYQ